MSKKNILVVIFIILFIVLAITGGMYFYVSQTQVEPSILSEQQVDTLNDIQENPVEQQVTQTDDVVLDSNSAFFDSTAQEASETPSASVFTVRAIATSFVERFGSFSTDSDYANIEELKPFMTERMKQWAQGFVEEQRAEDAEQERDFYGVSTVVLSANNSLFDEEGGIAEFTINTQRIESRGITRETSVGYQEIIVSFIRQDDVWLVDKADWQ